MLRFTWSTQVSVMLSQVLHPGNLFYIVVNLTTGGEIVSADDLAEEVKFYSICMSISLFHSSIQELIRIWPQSSQWEFWHQLSLGQDFASAGFEVCL